MSCLARLFLRLPGHHFYTTRRQEAVFSSFKRLVVNDVDRSGLCLSIIGVSLNPHSSAFPPGLRDLWPHVNGGIYTVQSLVSPSRTNGLPRHDEAYGDRHKT